MNKAEVDRYLPEATAVYASMHGQKPRKFIEAIKVKATPAKFNPSSQGDYAYTKSFVWDGETLESGPAYSYDSMLAVGVDPYERTVDVPPGKRVWVVTWDGQWGGYWSRVIVFVHPSELPASAMALEAGR